MHYGIIHSNTNEILSAVSLPFINNCFVPKKYIKAIPGDLFLADTSEDRKDCGKGIEINGLTNHAVVGGLHTMHIRDKHSLFVPFYKALFTRSNTFHKFAYKYSEGIKVFSLKPSLFKYLDFYYPEKLEQQKIVDLFEYIDTKIALLEKKIEALKKYRKGLIQIGLKQVYSSGSFVRFSDLYVDINERNIDSFNQYTVGKEGLKPILESNYDLQNHKIFQPNCLLIGIGIEEIAVSVNDSGSVSPVYNVYRINNKDYLNYTRFFLKPILWRKKAFITRKSTRREYEIDAKELLRFNLPVPVDSQFGKVCKSIEALDILIQQFTNKLKQLNKVKSYLLMNMFI